MKLIRFCAENGEKSESFKPGLLKEDGKIVDLTTIFPDIPDISRKFFSQGWVEKTAEIDETGKKMDVHLGCPVADPSKIICLGKNYKEHAKEGGFDVPEKPLLFCKTLNTLNGPFDSVEMPRSSGQIDWEVELAIVIGKQGRRISREQAYDYIAGYTVMNDVSAREAQFAFSQWFRGKSFDGFAPMGPCLVTSDEIKNPHDLRLTARVNGKTMQDGNTNDMIFQIPAIIENISEDITLEPGDIIATGTPSGVGIFRDPPIVIKAGDTVECEIEDIGKIVNKFV
ncbi:fumarylacetoacetate hydrolase family protein [Desulfobacterales bacterium HSG16]|nr:fumarylacetoacetate hydrolase family protein [Desulfobacterales bacterium HSG16]